MNLSFDELRELLVTIDQTGITEFELKSGNWELAIRKQAQGAVIVPTASAGVPAAVDHSAMVTPTPIMPAPAAAPPAPSAAPPMGDPKLVDVTSPMVGTFYRAPAPDEPPFVAVGDRVSTGQTVCIIEAMKLMNELEAEVSGQVVELLVENGQPVEFGQVLMRVDPG